MLQILVYFSIIAYKPQRTLDQALPQYSFRQAITEVVDPDITVSRYSRTWRFSQPKIHNGYLVGKLGFLSAGTEKRTDYDEVKKDFIEQTVDSKESTFVFWVIDLSKQILAFETKPPDIRYQSFKGAFEGFLNRRSHIGLTVEDIVETSRFIEWVRTVDRVTKFTANLRAPNPDYSRHPDFIRRILEQTNADRAKVELVKVTESTDSLDTENAIKDMVEYGEKGYSSIMARGQEGEQLRIFDSRRRVPVERTSFPEGATDEQRWNSIIEALRQFTK